MEEKIAQILREMYAVNPEFKKYEPELAKAAAAMLAAKPEAKFDDDFKAELRRKLLAAAEKLAQAEIPARTKGFAVSGWRKWLPLSVGVALVAVLVAALYVFPEAKKAMPEQPESPSIAKSGGVKISQIGSGAFGHILAQVSATAETAGHPASAQDASYGGENSRNSTLDESVSPPSPAPVAVPAVPSGTGIGGGGVASGKIISSVMPYQPVTYKYVYGGDEIKLEDIQLEVLKRIKGTDQGFLAEIPWGFSLGLADASQFRNAKVRYLDVYEDADGGYEISISPADGTLNISMNWDKWSGLTNSCPPEGCPNLTIGDVPSDDELVGMADQFLAKYRIDASIYGAPEVNREWQTFYARPGNSVDVNIPQQMSVRYPLLINGRSVYEQWGNQSGLEVAVDIRYKAVTGVNGLMTQNYQSSSYAAETSADRVLRLAANGGIYEYPTAETAGAEVREVELGTPQLGYMKYWNYQNGGQAEELLVPALIFPITKVPDAQDTYYYFNRQSVIIPIVKEILDQAEESQSGRIMPLLVPTPDAITTPAPTDEPAAVADNPVRKDQQ